MSLSHVPSAGDALGLLSRFRVEFYDCLYTRADALFELTDAVLCADGPVNTLVELSLALEHRRGHGALYAALDRGWLEPTRLRRTLADLPLPRVADGRIGLAVDVSNWLRPDAPTSGDRLFCHCYGHGGRSSDQLVPGWPYSFVAALEAGRTSWVGLLDAVRLGPADDATAITAAQLREVVDRLIAAGHWRPGDPDIMIVMDAGYDGPRLAHVLADLPVEIVVRLRSDRVMLRDPGPPRSIPRGGRPRRHGGVLTLSKPDSWHTPDATTSTDTTRYGKADAQAWDRMHPRLQRRGPWLEYTDAELPVLHGTLVRLKVERLPGDRDAPPVWLWSSTTGGHRRAPGPDLAHLPAQIRPGTHIQAAQRHTRLDRPPVPQPGHRRPVDLADPRRAHPAPPRAPACRGPAPPLGEARAAEQAHARPGPSRVPQHPREDAHPGRCAATDTPRPRAPARREEPQARTPLRRREDRQT